jgi:hypothetical protein
MGFIDVVDKVLLPFGQPKVGAGAVTAGDRQLLDEVDDSLGALLALRGAFSSTRSGPNLLAGALLSATLIQLRAAGVAPNSAL